ncbi:MAG: adenylate/guanylate cyclase domain-containing protein [Bacteroidota bacterium]
MNAQAKSRLRLVANIAIAYAIIGLVISVYDHSVLYGTFPTGLIATYSLVGSLIYNAIAGLGAGLLGGLLLTSLNRKIRNRPFIYGQVWGAIIFVTIFALVSVSTAFISSYSIVQDSAEELVLSDTFMEWLFSGIYLKNLIIWGIVFQFTQFYLQLEQKFGPGNLYNIFSGKYHTPKEEERIFMFLDLKSSTTIAEKLGEKKYHQFLQDVFSDITEPISSNRAEIYQYVGDEVILTWLLQNVQNRAVCVNIYFAIESIFELKKQAYLEKYQTVPRFKAGAHIGNSIVGEIGIIKRDITYSGDLLNTTARIQGMCNELKSKFLISGQLRQYLANAIDQSSLADKGFIALKGKRTQVTLFSVADMGE